LTRVPVGRLAPLALVSIALASPVGAGGAADVDAVTLASDRSVVRLRLEPNHGRVPLAGSVSSADGSVVTLQSKACGSRWRSVDSTVPVGRAWKLDSPLVEIRTSFRARWKSATSRTLTIDARPFVSLEQGETNGWWLVRIYALRYFVGRTVRVERLGTTRGWRVVRRVRLTRSEFGETYGAFRAQRLRGTLRAVLSRSQARPCYLAGYSTIVTTD
jgi:hypothetical protein